MSSQPIAILMSINGKSTIVGMDEIRKYVERATPKKVKDIKVIGLCPVCNMYVGGNKNYPFCRHCGQALNWSDEE